MASAGTLRVSSFEEVYASYRVFILDIDGTLMNGNENVEGAVDSVFRLMTDASKKVLFFTNGGYCSLHATFTKIHSWLKNNLSPEKFAQIESAMTKDIVYNTAQLSAKYLLQQLQPGDKVLTFGN